MAELIRLFGAEPKSRPFLEVFQERAGTLRSEYQQFEQPDTNRAGLLLYPHRRPLDVAQEITLLINERIKALGFVAGQHYGQEDVDRFHGDGQINSLYCLAHMRLAQDLIGASETWCKAYQQMGPEALDKGFLRSPMNKGVSEEYYKDIIAFPLASPDLWVFRTRCEALGRDIDQRHQILVQSAAHPAETLEIPTR